LAPTRDVFDNPEAYDVLVDLPGVSKNDIEVLAREDEAICIRGAAKPSDVEHEFRFRERFYGRFCRTGIILIWYFYSKFASRTRSTWTTFK
jgi:HSP20 family molecular chaperone IbpA